MRILFADSNHPVLHELLIAAGFQCDLFWDRSPEDLVKMLPGYEGLVIRSRFRLTKEVLETAEKLKVIGRVGAGMENIDLEFASKKNITCLCGPEGNRDAVGEHATGMLLMLLNHLKRADAEVRQGIWRRAANRGTEIKDKTVGIIGYGNMGSAFAEKLSGFGCRILAYDKYKSGFGTPVVTETNLQHIFSECDIVSLHLPQSAETINFVNADFIASFSKPFYLINTARGKCVNTADLVKALESGKIAGACLDVFEYETSSFEKLDAAKLPPDWRYLINSDKVILSPHIAGWTHESNYKMSRMIAEKMIAALKN